MALSFNNHKLDISHPVLITVCAAPGVVDRLEAAMEKRSWRNGVSNFDSYVSAARRPSFVPQITSSNTCIAFVDFDNSPEQAVETSLYLAQIFAGRITVVALAKSHNSDKILTAMRAGCTEFLSVPLQDADLTDIFDRLERQWLSTRWSPSHSGSLLSFFGVKGGAGSTTLAVHLALYLAKYHHKRTLLIDHHPELGHVCVYLGIDGSRCQLQEVVRNVNRLDSELLQGFVAKHSSGLDVLSSPDTCSGGKIVDQDALNKTLDFLRSEYDYVLVDCNIDYEDHNLAVLTASQHIYMVSTQEVGSIRNLSRLIDRFALFDISLEMIQIVLNRVSSSDAIQVEQVEKAMKLPIAIRIPNGGAEFMRAANLGEPLLYGSKSVLSDRILKWAETVAGEPAQNVTPEKKTRNLISLWK
jgi:pilus assembly protein CpaE